MQAVWGSVGCPCKYVPAAHIRRVPYVRTSLLDVHTNVPMHATFHSRAAQQLKRQKTGNMNCACWILEV